MRRIGYLVTVEGTGWVDSCLGFEVDEVVWQRLHIQPSNGVGQILHPRLRHVWGRRTEPVDVPKRKMYQEMEMFT